MEYHFLLKCPCGWKRKSRGIQADLEDLKEIIDCSKCGGRPRKFRCPQCNGVAKQWDTRKRQQ